MGIKIIELIHKKMKKEVCIKSNHANKQKLKLEHKYLCLDFI